MRSTRTGRIEGPFLPATASNVGMVQLTLFSPQSRAAARPLAAARGLGREEGVLVRFSVIGKAPDLAKKCPCSPYKKAPSRCVDASNEAWRLRSQLRLSRAAARLVMEQRQRGQQRLELILGWSATKSTLPSATPWRENSEGTQISRIISAPAGFTLAETLRVVGGCSAQKLAFIAERHVEPLAE